jgi:hypothetical protein
MCPEQPLSGTLFLSFPDLLPLKGIDHMTSTLCQSAALALIMALWVAKLAEFFDVVVKAIVTIAEIVRPTLQKTAPRLQVFGTGCVGRFSSRRLASFVAASDALPKAEGAHGTGGHKTQGMGLDSRRAPT